MHDMVGRVDAPSKRVDVDKILVRLDLVLCQVFGVANYRKKRSVGSWE